MSQEKGLVQENKEVDLVTNNPSSPTGGVIAFPIEGPLGNERYRLTVGMTDEDRAYRAQWLKDQILAESEPINVPGYYEARFNPIRRASMWPLNTLFKPLYNRYGHGNENVFIARFALGKSLMALAFGAATYYYFLNNTSKWTSHSGWRVYRSRTMRLPGDEGYGVSVIKDRDEFCDYGFKNSPI